MGWAPEYVEAMFLMLQQDNPEDFVIATGESHRLEDSVALAFRSVELDWHDHVIIDQDFFRPSEIKFGCGIATKAQEKLGWIPADKTHQVIEHMMLSPSDTMGKS